MGGFRRSCYQDAMKFLDEKFLIEYEARLQKSPGKIETHALENHNGAPNWDGAELGL
jgi:hypothetical protein